MSPPTNDAFDLLIQPWIPCERLDGGREELGIRAVLDRAHELSQVRDQSPLSTIMIHRLLLAILQRALAPADRKAWLALWKAPTLPSGPVAEYLDRWAQRFRLFDPERPFLQVAGLEKQLLAERGKPGERMSLWRMIMETSSHSSVAVHFERVPEDARLTPAEAARGLLGFIGYAQGGRIQNEAESWKGGALRGGAAVLATGKTLRETLLLNLIYEPPAAGDIPPWERDRPIGRTLRGTTGPIDQLVLPVRRVELFPEKEEHGTVVREVISGAGERVDTPFADPQFAYFARDATKGPVALRLDEERAAWRDSTALFDAATGADQFKQPKALKQIADLVLARELPRAARYRLALFGMATDQARILMWRAEQIPLPLAVLSEPERVGTLKTALARAEKVGEELSNKALFILCARFLSTGERKPDTKDVTALRSSLSVMPRYWAALGVAFEKWLVTMSELDDPDEALPPWSDQVRRAARAAFNDAVHRLGERARVEIAAVDASRRLEALLREHVPKPTASKQTQPNPGGAA